MLGSKTNEGAAKNNAFTQTGSWTGYPQFKAQYAYREAIASPLADV